MNRYFFPVVFFSLALCACFNPGGRREAILLVSAAFPEETGFIAGDISGFSYIIELTNSESKELTEIESKPQISHNFSFSDSGSTESKKMESILLDSILKIKPGYYEIIIKAYSGNKLRAWGNVGIDVKSGKNSPASVEMIRLAAAADWEELRGAVEALDTFYPENNREEIILITNSFKIPENSKSISIRRMITLAAEDEVTIFGGNLHDDSLFRVGEDGQLNLGTKNGINGTITFDCENKPASCPIIFVNGKCSIYNNVTLKGRVNRYNIVSGAAVFVSSRNKNGNPFNKTHFILDGGIITGNSADSGGAVFVDSTSFNMFDGTIEDNSAINGGAVFCSDGGFFTMHGGIITGNTAEIDGGGVFISGSVFIMEGGFIEKNAAAGGKAEVFGGVSGVVSAMNMDPLSHIRNNSPRDFRQ